MTQKIFGPKINDEDDYEIRPNGQLATLFNDFNIKKKLFTVFRDKTSLSSSPIDVR